MSGSGCVRSSVLVITIFVSRVGNKGATQLYLGLGRIVESYFCYKLGIVNIVPFSY